MAQVNPPLPAVGLSTRTEDAKIRAALSQLESAVNTIEAVQIADGAVTAAKIEDQQAWQSASAPTTGTISYYKDSLGVVHIKPTPLFTTVSLSIGTVVATLPAGYRPAVQIAIVMVPIIATSAWHVAFVNADGTISMTDEIPQSHSFSFNAHFVAEQ
jgi:hypothetical protein